ncbi:MAG: DUF3667 domain-containing protein [Flavobacterium sp.]|uniref:DUF3667 domain-containing protein n=1 Tax=Flavobacterium sp. TaxID=239 RepID=UPI0012231C5D|nr:DUF3667 domain-containing protein [Flavobacterium sp.]RZJ67766.1 MAG: DUF3667 domain-containing protein [Flavobacterium sp.]
MTCKNCNSNFEGNFCNNCGQKAKTERLNWRYISDEAKYVFLHFNGGLMYSVKALFTRPGDSIREFIEGKRVHHYKPILLLFVLAGIYGVLVHYVDFEAYVTTVPRSEEEKLAMEIQRKVITWFVDHYSLVEILQLPLYSICSYLAFRKWGYNFIEHVILNTFASAQRLVINIVLVPFLILMSHISKEFFWAISFVSFGSFIFTVWTLITFFRGRDLGAIILRMLLFCVLMSIVMFILIVIGSISIVVLRPDLIGK